MVRRFRIQNLTKIRSELSEIYCSEVSQVGASKNLSPPTINKQSNILKTPVVPTGVLKIGYWVRYGLNLKGRITVTKSLLLSQYTYVATILDSNDKKLTDKVQAQIDLFVYNNKVGSKDNSSFQL